MNSSVRKRIYKAHDQVFNMKVMNLCIKVQEGPKDPKILDNLGRGQRLGTISDKKVDDLINAPQ